MWPDHDILAFTKGVQNLLDDELIATDAATDASNWYVQDGRLKLIPGRLRVGTEGVSGSVLGQIFGYKVDGNKIHWRKIGTKIQYYNGTTWIDTVTGLTATADYWFTNYSSLAGTFTYAFGVDGIYKMHNAVPASFNSMYSSAKNYKGFAFIDKGRTFLWNRTEDKTGLYGSYIDAQNSTVYTSVSGEATVSLGGTLAFKGGGATRNCFGVSIVVGAETYTDNYLGVLTGSLGGTGTINYISGVYTVSLAGVGAAAYQWEDSNAKGVTDFTHSATRLAGEGFQFPQDEGGDAIKRVLVGLDGAYYSLKLQSAYRLEIDASDLATGATTSNQVYRRGMGMPSLRGGTSMQKGIVFMNTATSEKPELTILQKNPVGGSVEPIVLFPEFKFANYNYDDCTIETWERYVIVMCRGLTAPTTANDTILLCNMTDGTVSITNYSARTASGDQSNLYVGSSVTQTVYQLYTGVDDDGLSINNFWDSKAETLRPHLRRAVGDLLKKHRLLVFKGNIEPNQSVQVYTNYDSSGWGLVGTIVGSGAYVDASGSEAIGVSEVGASQVGADVNSQTFPFMMQIRVKSPKFRKRKIRLKAIGIGYVDFEMMSDRRITPYEAKIPARFINKNNVSLDGLSTNQANPSY